MQTPIFPTTLVLIALAAGIGSAAAADPLFEVPNVPPPEAPKPAAASMFDALATGATSPLGVDTQSVRPDELFSHAASFLSPAAGRPANYAEAAFWLKRAMAIAPDETGKRRAWAALRLGALLRDQGKDAGDPIVRQLFELAAAWGDAQAMYYLGALAEQAGSGGRTDPVQARLWYERSKQAGYRPADEALSRMKN